MKSKLRRVSVVGIVFLIALFYSCGKDAQIEIGNENEAQQKVTLKLKTFDTHTVPIQYIQSENSSSWNRLHANENTDQNVFPSEETQYLYIWTFNDSSIRPDIGIDRLHANISVLKTNGQNNYDYSNNGYAFLNYSGGRSLNIAGPEKIIFQMPVNQVEKLDLLRFDMSGSSTGPKDFSIYYQRDNQEQVLISEENQFSSLSGKNTFEYDLSEFDLGEGVEELNIIIIPKEGQREGGSPYNRSTGTLRIDNFALQGRYSGKWNEPEKPKAGMLHYHIFDQESGEFVLSGQKNLNLQELEHEIEFQLLEGIYQICVLVNNSPNSLYFPDQELHASEFYVQSRNEANGHMVFGSVLSDFEVNEDMEMEVALERYYSEIVYEFEDNLEETAIHSIKVEPQQSIFYAPFNPSFSNPEDAQPGDLSKIFYLDSFKNGSIMFHQFIGFRDDPIELRYRLSAYDQENNLLNEVLTSAEITHNMKLIFSGYLLGSNAGSRQVYRIDWEAPWRESIRIIF